MAVSVRTVAPINPKEPGPMADQASPPVRVSRRNHRTGTHVGVEEGTLTVYDSANNQVGGHAIGTWTEYTITPPKTTGDQA